MPDAPASPEPKPSSAPAGRILVEHLTGARAGEQQEFPLGTELRFGRHADCEVRFDARQDLDASSRHAVLRKVGNDSELVDVGSSSGTFRHGQRVSGMVLRPNRAEELQFGRGGPRCRITIEDPSVATPAADDADADAPRTRVGLDARPSVLGDARQPGSRTVRFLRSLVDDSVNRTTRRLRRLVLVLALLLVAAATLAILFAAGLIGRHGLDAAQVAQRYRGAIFLVVDARTGAPQCTAFVVAPHRLATNGHCTFGDNEASLDLRVIRNGKPADSFPVLRFFRHDRYQHQTHMPSYDAAVLEVAEDLGPPLPLASNERLAAIEPGQRVFSYGFPGTLANPDMPEATMTEGLIGRITRFDGSVGTFDDNRLVQHSAYTTGGTSGSPVFDTDGTVIAISAGHYTSFNVGPMHDMEQDQTRMVGTVQELMGYSFAIRIDTLHEVLTANRSADD
jgi:hypothetical protein